MTPRKKNSASKNTQTAQGKRTLSKSQKTERMLAKSFRQLIARKPLDKITVTAITNNCNINRQTFYYHFRDINELIAWIYTNELHEIFGEKPTYGTWQEDLLKFLQFTKKNRQFILKTVRSVDTHFALHYLHLQSEDIITNMLKAQQDDYKISDRDFSLISRFYGAGLVGIILQWLDDGKESPEDFVARIETLVGGEIPRAMERFAERN